MLIYYIYIIYIHSSHLNYTHILQTTWDRPGLDGELNNGQLNDSAQSNDKSVQSESDGESADEYSNNDENTLPPNWIGKELFALINF